MQQRFQEESRKAQHSPMELTCMVAVFGGAGVMRVPDPGWEHVVRDAQTGKEYWGHGPTAEEAKSWAWKQVPKE